MRLKRFRLRTLLIAVAAVGLILGAAVHVRRSQRLARFYHSQAMVHRFNASIEEMALAPQEPVGYYVPRPELSPAVVERSKKRIAHEYAMAERYEWASRYPWVPLGPDPPEP